MKKHKTILLPLGRQFSIILVLFIVCTAGITLYNTQDYVRVQTDFLSSSLDSYSSQLAKNTLEAYDSYKNICYSVAYSSVVQDFLSSKNRQSSYEAYQELRTQLENTFLLNPYISDIAVYGQDFCHYGLEGIDYEKDKDGNYSCLPDTKGESLTTALARKYPSSILFSGIATWGGSWKDFEVNDMNTLRYGKFATILASESANYCKEHTTQVSRPYAFMSYPKEPTEEFSTSNAFKQFISCIIGNDDAVDMWENVLKQMRSDGLDEYIQRQNENFAKSQN